MICGGCGNTKAYKTMQMGDDPEMCDKCGVFDGATLPDVYFRRSGETYQNITDEKGNPMTFYSRREKARFMKERNLSEAGDRVRGGYGFSTPTRESPEARRAAVKEAVAKAYQKIKYGGRRG